MRNITKTFETTTKDNRNIRVFISNIRLDYKDRAVLKHLANSNVDIMALKDLNEARALAKSLETEKKLVTSQKGIHIRFQEWHDSKSASRSDNSKPCEDPSLSVDHIYDQALVNRISEMLVNWCKSRKCQNVITANMLRSCVIYQVYGSHLRNLDRHQEAVVSFITDKYLNRFCIQAKSGRYILGTELMSKMCPKGALYSTHGTKRTYIIVHENHAYNTEKKTVIRIPKSTLSERSERRLDLDRELYFCTAMAR